jgi:hypothetical protein
MDADNRLFMMNIKDYNDDLSSLPIALKILSELNLENKNVMVRFEDKPTHLLFETMKFYSDINDLDCLTELNILIKQCVNFINKKLKDYDNLYIANIVESITILDDTPSKMILTTRITFD